MAMQVRAKRVRDRWTVEQGTPTLVRPDAATAAASSMAPLIRGGASLAAEWATATAAALPPSVTVAQTGGWGVAPWGTSGWGE
jgi:hypothetical protein